MTCQASRSGTDARPAAAFSARRGIDMPPLGHNNGRAVGRQGGRSIEQGLSETTTESRNVGGGRDAFSGGVHRMAMRLDGGITLIAGAFSSDAAKSRLSGADLLLDPKRVYPDYETMAAEEAKLPPEERIDFVSVATQPDTRSGPPGISEGRVSRRVPKPLGIDLAKALACAKSLGELGVAGESKPSRKGNRSRWFATSRRSTMASPAWPSSRPPSRARKPAEFGAHCTLDPVFVACVSAAGDLVWRSYLSRPRRDTHGWRAPAVATSVVELFFLCAVLMLATGPEKKLVFVPTCQWFLVPIADGRPVVVECGKENDG